MSGWQAIPAITYRFHERARLALIIFMYEKNGKEAVEEYLLQTMKALFCFNNPDKLVLYSETIDESLFGKLEQMCENRIEKMLIPEIL